MHGCVLCFQKETAACYGSIWNRIQAGNCAIKIFFCSLVPTILNTGAPILKIMGCKLL